MLKDIALQLTIYIESTYLCESAFFHMKIIKSKYRGTLMCLHLAVTNNVPSFKLTDNMQCHAFKFKLKLRIYFK